MKSISIRYNKFQFHALPLLLYTVCIFLALHITGIWPMDLNFPVFATGVRICRASNDVGSWVHTNTRKKNTRKETKWRGAAKFLIIVDFPDFWKINGWNALIVWTPISCFAPGLLLLSYSYYFAYIPPTICSQDRLSTMAEV
jgi:hypothetical protein